MNVLAAALGTILVLSACARPAPTRSASETTRANVPAAAPSARTAAPATPSAAPSAAAGHAGPVPLRTPRTAAPPHAAAAAVPRGAARHATAAAHAAPVMPQILGASVSPTVVGSGTVVSATVTTTPGVVSVTAFAGGTSMPVPRVGPGLFRGSTTLPPLPPFAHGSYAVTFVARDARGLSTQSAVGVTVR
ncbi:MAG TPA: hypothetical protein VE826_13815 [Dongiaceae bacterium]|nr:hypothetical protein [Dongiaceae bacterium]